MSNSRFLRLFTIFFLYIAQGIPIGLFWFAIPAWMAANGADAAAIGSVLSLTALPWSLKFFNGFIMDRYAYMPMGRRRAWVLGAQLVMVMVFVAAALIQPEANDILLLGVLGFLGNLATTFQDVGVDGMAVDLLKENERAKGGGMMFGGQLIGTAMATAGTGWAIEYLGVSGAYLIAAGAVSVVCVYLMAIRERENERLFPWSPGVAHPRNLELFLGEWLPIFKTTLKSMFQPIVILWMLFIVTKGAQYGVMTGVTPLIGAGEAGLSEARVTSLTGTAQLVAGLLGLSLGSWLGDRLGVKWSSLLLLAAWMTFSGGMILAFPQWSDPAFTPKFIFAWVILDTLFSIVTVPMSMRLCEPRVAATQFALFMAVNNFGISMGTMLLGFSGALGGLVKLFPILIGVNIFGALILLLVRFPRRSSAY